jgi:Aerotolerance regulator N-terminal/von Willebrand factor type A domain
MAASLYLFAVLFESTLATAAVAGGAVSIPIIIHLLNRRRFKIVTWAAMRFLLAAQKKSSRRMRIEQLLLLIVRCLIVLLIVLAMASVTSWAESAWRWFAPEGAKIYSGSGARVHKIIVLDGSFSMALKNGDAACFDRARALAARMVRESASGDGFSVVLMAAPPRRIVPEPSEDANKVIKEIEAVRLPHGNADLAATLNTVESMLQASPSKFVDRQVYFLTDLQQSTWIAKQPGTLAGTLQKIQAKARTVFVDVGVENAANLAVTGLTLGDEIATTGRETVIMATLHNYGTETRDHVRVKLFIGRARSTANEPPMELREIQESVLRAERAQQTPVAFAYKFPAAGEYVVQVQIENDGLELDDVRSILVTVKKDVPVLLVNGKPSGDPFDQATEWLRLALNPFDGASAPGNVAARPMVINPLKFADETQGDLTNYDCVFLCDVPTFSAAEVKRLESHLRRGGGVVFCLGSQVQTGEYNRLLYKSGAGLLPAPLVGVQGATNAFNYQFAIDPDAEREPPLKAFRASTDRARLLEPRFNKFVMTGEPTTGVKPRKVLGFSPILIPGRENSPGAKQPPPAGPAILEWNPPTPREAKHPTNELSSRMRGKVVLVTTTANSDWNHWPPTPCYPALMQELLYFASSGRLREQEYAVGDVLEVFLRTSSTGNEAKIHTPDGREETGRTQALDDASVLRWTDTDVSGLYRVTIGQDPHEYFFAVNVPTGAGAGSGDSAPALGNESDLQRTDRDEMQKTYPEWEFQIVRDLNQISLAPLAGSASEYTTGGALGAGVAHWLLMIVLVLIVAEIVLAWQFGHYSAAGVQDETPQKQPSKWQWLLPPLACLLFSFSILFGFVLLHDAITGDFLGFLPDFCRRGFERLMDIPAPAPGEGSRWRLEYMSYLWDGKSDPWLVGLLISGAAVLVYLIYRREGTRTNTTARVLMMGLRIGLVGLILLVFLPQLKLWFERQAWPDVVLLIDDSESMSTLDTFRDPRVKAAAERLSQLENVTEADRLRLAQALVTRSEPDWLTTLLMQRKVRLHVYHCSTKAHRIKDVNTAAEIGPALEVIRELKATPENDSSQLGMAVRQVLNDFRGSSLAAVVMLTDGVTTEGEDLVKVSKYASQMGVPLFFVGIGDDNESRDVYLHDLQVEDSVYVNDRVVFELRLTAQGYNNLTAPVVLREQGKPEELARQVVTIDGPGKAVKVRLVHSPTEPGRKVYVIDTPLQPDETDKDNNRLEKEVFVHEAKLIKVLYVEGYRRYEFHYIKTLLERESARTKGNKSIDLKVLLLEADADYAAQDRSAIADFPTKAELNTYDVVILGDVDPRPNDNNKMAEHMRDLADFVRERGGGLLMIAGERYAPHTYKDSPLRDVLPIDVTTEQQPDDVQRTEGYHLELTPVGRMHPIFRFSPDEHENDEIWNKLREMYWFSDGYVPKRAAEILAVHPTKKVRSEKSAVKPGDAADEAAVFDKHPLVLQQFVGAGRTMFFGFNETWRWGFREDHLHFNQFWIQTVRYLARSRLGRIDLRLDRQTPYRRGEPIKVTVRFPDDAPPPPNDTDVKVVVERRQPGRGAETEVRTLQLAKLDRSRATYEALLTKTPEGEYKFWLTSPSSPSTGAKPRADGKVLAPPGEMERLRMAASDMKRAAEETHGEFYTLANADALVKDLPVGSRVTLNAPGPPWLVWNHVLLFFVALLYLTTEWLIRKQQNLL